jgi:hypothetical protein
MPVNPLSALPVEFPDRLPDKVLAYVDVGRGTNPDWEAWVLFQDLSTDTNRKYRWLAYVISGFTTGPKNYDVQFIDDSKLRIMAEELYSVLESRLDV